MRRHTYDLAPGLRLAVRARSEPALYRSLFGSAEDGATRADVELTLGVHLDATCAHGRYKGIPWGLMARGEQGGRMEAAFHAPLFSPYLALHLAVIPAAQVVLRREGRTLIAGAAVETADGITLFLGATGAGKTGAMLRAVTAGARPVGDEYVALGARGDVVPLLHGVALRRNLRTDAPALYQRLSRRDRRLLELLHIAAIASRGRLRPLLHIAWSRLGLAQERAASGVARAIWIEPRAGETRTVSPADIAARAVRHMQAHAAAYGDPIAAAGIGATGNDAEVLECALARAACYVAPAPSEADVCGAPMPKARLAQ